MGQRCATTVFGFVILACAAVSAAETAVWLEDYGHAMSRARSNQQMMLVYFHREGVTSEADPLCRQIAGDAKLQAAAGRYVLVRVSESSRARVQGKELRLIGHRAFADLNRQPGVAIIDFVHRDAVEYGHVVETCSMDASGTLASGDFQRLFPEPVELSPELAHQIHWFSDYGQAMEEARRGQRLMLVYFHGDGDDIDQDPLCTKMTRDPQLAPLTARHVLVRLPLAYRERVHDQELRLLDHRAFSELHGKPGIAIIDFQDSAREYFGHVVSIYPLSLPGARTERDLHALLSLPEGSLTQRTLILAVRIHPEGPASTSGTMLTTLARESESHSLHQAQIRNQGHHNWDSRFHRISDELPDGMLAEEVCAESWPGEGLIAAAIDVVQSWRQSSGHWSKVRGRHRYYGYDMKRGGNGIWYATGIFSNR